MHKLKMVAVQLKAEPELKLSQIATAFGFYDEFHMSKAFKQMFGISPETTGICPSGNRRIRLPRSHFRKDRKEYRRSHFR